MKGSWTALSSKKRWSGATFLNDHSGSCVENRIGEDESGLGELFRQPDEGRHLGPGGINGDERRGRSPLRSTDS